MLLYANRTLEDEVQRLKRCCGGGYTPNWVSLPVEGHELRWCFITSTGRRGTAVIATPDLPLLHVPLDHHMIFGALDGVEQTLLSLDDTEIALIIEPVAGTSIRLVEAAVDFWLTKENPKEDPVAFMRPPASDETWELQAGFNLKLKLGPSPQAPA